MARPDCPFCDIASDRIVRASSTAFAVFDAYPVSEGHALIVPRRHIGSWFDTSELEQRDVLSLLAQLKRDIDSRHKPAGYNVGINDGAAAGQTIAHLHVHLIPRYPGQTSDPRGGVRWVLPDKADYWTNKG